MAYSKLQPEVWRHIIGFLRRDVPPAHELKDWSECHQQDLATVSRVCSTFHSMAAGSLYSNITASSLPFLLQGFDSQSIPSRLSLTKAELFGYTQTLHIAHCAPKIVPDESPSQILSQSTWWNEVAELESATTSRFREYRNNLVRELLNCEKRYRSITNVMPALQHLILGRTSDLGSWYLDNILMGNEVMEQTWDMIRPVLTHFFLAAFRPSVICILCPSGPFVPALPAEIRPNHPVFHETRGVIINTHYRYRVTRPILVSGAVNRLFYDPGVAFGWEIFNPSRFACCPINRGVRRFFDDFKLKSYFYDTKIEIYGIGRHLWLQQHPAGLATPAAIQADVQKRSEEPTEAESDPAIAEHFANLRQAEEHQIEALRDCVAKTLESPQLPDMISVHTKAEAPACEGCHDCLASNMVSMVSYGHYGMGVFLPGPRV